MASRQVRTTTRQSRRPAGGDRWPDPNGRGLAGRATSLRGSASGVPAPALASGGTNLEPRAPPPFIGIRSPSTTSNAWHAYNAAFTPPRDYAGHIEASCQGDPSTGESARGRCTRRSPRGHLDEARQAEVPVYIAHGADDTLVPPDHALRAFNQLAAEDDAIGDRSLDRVADNVLPDYLRGAVDAESFFGERDPDVRFSRRSGATTVTLFDGEHNMVYNPGLRWITEQAGR